MPSSARLPASIIEFDLLCLLARPTPDLGRAAALLGGRLDFARLFLLAEKHGVRPQLVDGLYRVSWENVPAEVRAAFEDFRWLHGVRALVLSEALLDMSEAFTDAGLRFATFKGPALALALYGDVSRREYTDVDIIVAPEQIDQAERLLLALGYHADSGDPVFRHAFLDYLRQYAFVHPGKNATVDLHWDFTGTHVPFPLTPSDVWRDLDSLAIGGRTVPTVSGENLALLLAGHGTKEAWRCLGWICDFAMLIERHPDLDWSRVLERARSLRCGDTVLLGCAMARKLLDTPVPPALVGSLERSRRVRDLADLLTRHLGEGRSEASVQENFSDFYLCENWFDRLKGAVRLSFTRTTGDYEALKLPPALWPLYHVTRPFRVGAKVLAAVARAAGGPS